MKCPKCDSENTYSTLMGFIAFRDPVKNRNHTTCCDCRHQGLAWEFGAPDIQPMKGSENMTDEEIAYFLSHPKRIKARGMYNANGIQLVKFDKEKP